MLYEINTNCYATKGMMKFNEQRHKYINSIWKDIHGYIHISGDIGNRHYLYYSWKEAVTLYNKAAKKEEGIA